MSFPMQNTADLTATGSQDGSIQDQARPDANVIMVDGSGAATRYLMVIDGKLQYRETSGRTYPMDTLPEAFKEWLQQECGDREKKEAYLKWLVDAPLQLEEYGRLTGDPSPPSTSLTISRMRVMLEAADERIGILERQREEHLKEAIRSDYSFWDIKRNIKMFTRLIRLQEQRQDPSSSRLP